MNETLKIKSYRHTVMKCATCVVVLIATMFALSFLTLPLAAVLQKVLIPTAYDIVTSLIDAAVYFFSFTFPIVIFKKMSKKSGYYPLPASPVLPRDTGKICIAGISIIFCASILNSIIMSLICSFLGITPDMSLFETEINGIHSFVLLFISTAIIPALVEEFLFRGVILKNLLPYGKTVAIVISALLFSLMHTNFFQFFYTFIAGLVLGYVFLRTGSIWCSVLIHFINNFIAVLTEVFYYYMSEEAATMMQYLLHSVIVFFGIIALILLVRKEGRAKTENDLRKGSVYGVTESIAIPESDLKLTDRQAIKNFFVPMTWVMLAASVLYACYVLLMLTMV